MEDRNAPTPSLDEALDQIRQAYEDGEAEINGRAYKFHATTHKQRKRVFAFFTKIRAQLEDGDLSWLASSEYEDVENLVENMVSLDGELLSRRQGHWEEFPEDYVIFSITAMGVISYPFLRGIGTG